MEGRKEGRKEEWREESEEHSTKKRWKEEGEGGRRSLDPKHLSHFQLGKESGIWPFYVATGESISYFVSL